MEDTKAKWYVDLLRAINGLAEELGLDDLGTGRVRDFIVSTAKAQYMEGNRSGIRWARTGKNKGANA